MQCTAARLASCSLFASSPKVLCASATSAGAGNNKTDDGPDYDQAAPKEGAPGSSLPTAAKYRALSVEDLSKMLVTRDTQIAQLRAIYEEFHYGVEKKYRRQIFDYHDKAVQFSQVHGQMQSASINMTKESLLRMREQQELENRDVKLIYTICILFVIAFWVYLRRHYINTTQIEEIEMTSGGSFTERAQRDWSPLPKFPSARDKMTWHEQEALAAKGGNDKKNRTPTEELKALEVAGVRSQRGWGNPTADAAAAASAPVVDEVESKSTTTK